jgi:hypothetical protein
MILSNTHHVFAGSVHTMMHVAQRKMQMKTQHTILFEFVPEPAA